MSRKPSRTDHFHARVMRICQAEHTNSFIIDCEAVTELCRLPEAWEKHSTYQYISFDNRISIIEVGACFLRALSTLPLDDALAHACQQLRAAMHSAALVGRRHGLQFDMEDLAERWREHRTLTSYVIQQCYKFYIWRSRPNQYATLQFCSKTVLMFYRLMYSCAERYLVEVYEGRFSSVRSRNLCIFEFMYSEVLSLSPRRLATISHWLARREQPNDPSCSWMDGWLHTWKSLVDYILDLNFPEHMIIAFSLDICAIEDLESCSGDCGHHR